MKYLVLTIYSLSIFSLEAATCPPEIKLHGNIKPEVERFDEMVSSLATSKNSKKVIEDYIAKNGFLEEVLIEEANQKKFPNRVTTEGIDGEVTYIMLKKMKDDPKSGVEMDVVYETQALDSDKSIREWNLPHNSPSGPIALIGEELLFEKNLAALCAKGSHKVFFAIKPDGTIRVTDKVEASIKNFDSCPAAKILFKNSAYSTCSEFIDPATKKKRYLIWETPMT